MSRKPPDTDGEGGDGYVDHFIAPDVPPERRWKFDPGAAFADFLRSGLAQGCPACGNSHLLEPPGVVSIEVGMTGPGRAQLIVMICCEGCKRKIRLNLDLPDIRHAGILIASIDADRARSPSKKPKRPARAAPPRGSASSASPDSPTRDRTVRPSRPDDSAPPIGIDESIERVLAVRRARTSDGVLRALGATRARRQKADDDSA